MRFLDRTECVARLNAGKTIELMLEPAEEAGHQIIRFAEISKVGTTYQATVSEVFDDGREDYFDVYGFEDLDPDNSPIVIVHHNFEGLCLLLGFSQLAHVDSFVAVGMLQRIYVERFHPEWL